MATDPTEFPISTEREDLTEPTEVDLDQLPEPTDVIPVIRHHLHETLLAVERAYGKSAAEDLIDNYREYGIGTPVHGSGLTRSLERTALRLQGYLGLLDEPELEQETEKPVPDPPPNPYKSEIRR